MSKLKNLECKSFINLIIHTSSTTQAVTVLQTVSTEQALAISEIVLNVLQGNITLSAEEKSTFKRHKNLLRRLSDSSLSSAHRVRLTRVNSSILVRLLRQLKHKLIPVLKQL